MTADKTVVENGATTTQSIKPSSNLPKRGCDLEFVIHAATSAYRIKKVPSNKIVDHPDFDPATPKKALEYNKMHDSLKERGYQFSDKIIPGLRPHDENSSLSLAATCMAPIDDDNKGPIIIAFRGTKTARDFKSDARLAITGVVEKKFRDDAFNFYKGMKKNTRIEKL